jgi:hypothetical protein
MTFDPNEERDPHGRWTRGGNDTGEIAKVIDPRVVDVSGDDWNRKTAERLEKEYADVRPEIDKIATEGVEKHAGVALGAEPEEEDEDAPVVPETWSDLSGSQQEEAEQSYIDNHIDQEKEYAVSNWQENGEALVEAKHALANDDDFKSEFLSEFLADREANDEARIPFSAGDLAGAIHIEAGDEHNDDPAITFDDKYLDKPDNFAHEGQMSFPGIEPQNPADFLTPKMREEITNALLEKFEEEAKSKAENIDPPDYLNEEAQTNVQEAWGSMSDEDQFEYAKDHVDSLKEQLEEPAKVARTPTIDLAWPEKFDPLNLTSGRDYMRTQALAKYIADKRGAQLITQRTDAGLIGRKGRLDTPAVISARAVLNDPNSNPGNVESAKKIIADFENVSGGWKPRDKFLGSDADYEKLYGTGGVGAKKDAAWTERMMKELQQVDFKLWSGWKGSSTNAEGRLLQVAASDELGGRIRDARPPKWKDPANDPPEVVLAKSVVGNPNSTAEDTGNHNLVIAAYKDGAPPAILKAMSDAAQGHKTPETDKMIMDYLSSSTGAKERAKAPNLDAESFNGGYIRLPKVVIEKNGAASTTVSRDVANGWNGTSNNAPEGINKKESIEYANHAYAAIGGYEGVKAALRAKWETTQYLLDKADIPVVQAYRGITYAHKLPGAANVGDFNPPASGIVKESGSQQSVNLAEMPVGASVKISSGKTITKVSAEDLPSGYAKGTGKWTYAEPKETQSRIVLRAEVPRTAVVSVPAYGVNVKSEQEVVVVGTGWKGWDAWSGRAPSFEEVPMHAPAPAAPKNPQS